MNRFTARCMDSVSWIALLNRMPTFNHSNYGLIMYATAQQLGIMEIDLK